MTTVGYGDFSNWITIQEDALVGMPLVMLL